MEIVVARWSPEEVRGGEDQALLLVRRVLEVELLALVREHPRGRARVEFERHEPVRRRLQAVGVRVRLRRGRQTRGGR